MAHNHFLVPGITPQPISALQLRCQAWYGSLGLIPGPIWKMSCNNLLIFFNSGGTQLKILGVKTEEVKVEEPMNTSTTEGWYLIVLWLRSWMYQTHCRSKSLVDCCNFQLLSIGQLSFLHHYDCHGMTEILLKMALKSHNCYLFALEDFKEGMT